MDTYECPAFQAPGTRHMKPLCSTVTKSRGLHMEGIKKVEELRLHYPGHKPDLLSGFFFPVL